ncbi:hypothetical protein [Membranihabitans maritimus]|uniref:hypothetical protein n=1 Tax=Membranihabitans maritimus TaxID=2904244 RepID=UPI001F18DC9E|nr:hypothetical protein [Membranihabitans maritimus]
MSCQERTPDKNREMVRQEEGFDIADCQVPELPFAIARGEENPLRLSILLSEIL